MDVPLVAEFSNYETGKRRRRRRRRRGRIRRIIVAPRPGCNLVAPVENQIL
jgi:hypothetical protein